jgi:hypothetical protein
MVCLFLSLIKYPSLLIIKGNDTLTKIGNTDNVKIFSIIPGVVVPKQHPWNP